MSAAAKTKKATVKNTKRVRPIPKHRSFKLSRKKLKPTKSIPSAWTLLKQTARTITSNKKIFLSIAGINALLAFVFVQGLGSTFSIVELKQSFDEAVGQNTSQITTGFALFGYLLGTAGSSASESAGAYQLMLTLVTSLVTIWMMRQVMAGEKPSLRDGYYVGMYPLIPFVLLLVVVAVQLLPLLIGNLIYSTVIQNSLAATALENIIWLLLFIMLALLSGYMLLSSIFSLYIVTLPEMRPLKALRSARELVLHRRFAVALRIIALPLVLVLIAVCIFVPLLIFAAPIAEILFLILSSLGLVILHVYMYLLYRSLL